MAGSKNDLISEILHYLQDKGLAIKGDSNLDDKQVSVQLDVLVDTMRFLKDYEENVHILDKYWSAIREHEKFNAER